MNMFDEARSLSGMLSLRGMTQGELAGMLGVSQPYVANKLRLLRFSESMQAAIIECGISERHARTLLRLSDERLQRQALGRIIAGRMNVAQCEIMVECMLEEQQAGIIPEGENLAERVMRFEDILETSLSNLRLFGIGARSSRERFMDKLYISICIG